LALGYWIDGQKARFFYFFFVVGLDLIYMNIGKISYAEIRPFYASYDFEAIKCSKSFGNPSGHSSGATATAYTIFLDIFHRAPSSEEDFLKRRLNFAPNYVYYPVLVFTLFYAFSVPYARYFVGVHSLNQIVYGSLLGIWCAKFMHCFVA
jgi:membrane-associated phospholipid phosphatase